MKTMSITDLKAHLSAAIQEVRQGETIQITRRGEVVALLKPVQRPPVLTPRTAAEIEESLASLEAFRAEMGRLVTEPTDVAALISEMRD